MQTAKRVLFVCTGNAGRSQIADALFARMTDHDAVVCSAGVEPWANLHPVAVRLLRECGIDISGRHPRHVREFMKIHLDYVVTIGDRALAETPRFKCNPVLLHWEISDPADADGTGREEEVFRTTLAMIEERLPGLAALVKTAK